MNSVFESAPVVADVAGGTDCWLTRLKPLAAVSLETISDRTQSPFFAAGVWGESFFTAVLLAILGTGGVELVGSTGLVSFVGCFSTAARLRVQILS